MPRHPGTRPLKLKMKAEILLETDEEILVVKFEHNNQIFILGVGDIVVHYTNEVAEITKFFVTDTGADGILYNYKTLNLPDFLNKHKASITNIVSIKEQTICSKNISEAWWDKEMKRRENLPRYVVMNDYPNSDYNVGEIIECFDKKFEINPTTLEWCEKYPHLFKKVAYAESRAYEIGVLAD
jgi:hypothetical protein